jgi:choline dehydrogenase-like flavoprotein
MIFDATTAEPGLVERPFDACVIGSGPAGITLARRLAAQGFAVALMEAGGLEFSDASQEIYQGAVTGLDYYPLDVARLRYFGGTSNHWGGWCRELDAHDFRPRPFHAFSGWPIQKADLDPYQAEADAILDLPPPPGFPDLPIPQAGNDFRHVLFRFSPPTRLGAKYHDEIKASDRISLFLNANLVDLRLGDDLGRVTEAVFATYPPAMRRFSVKAQVFCLCAGGIENPRLLLNFRSQMPGGIGNQNDMVGRCFSEHPHFVLADLLLAEPGDEKEFYAPTEAFIETHQVLNFGLRLEPDQKPRQLSFVRELRRSATCASAFTEELGARVFGRAIDCDRGGLAEYFERLTAPRPLTGKVRIAMEQHLNLQSRVMLGADTDVFGMNRMVLDWHLLPIDFDTMRAAVTAFGAFIAEADIGRLKVRDWLLAENPVLPGVAEDEVGGFHHMCTTRMSADPADGVVDGDCRVHGLGNLYIGGSSVFATTGHANPTYTIVQLALRLGDHLGSVVPRT